MSPTPGRIDLDGKVAVVTGAGQGLGATTAELFAELGARVVALDVDGPAARKVADAVGGLGIEVGTTRRVSVRGCGV